MVEPTATVDISPFRCEHRRREEPLSAAAAAVVDQWRDALEHRGVCHIIGHGVPDAILNRARAAAHAFFCESTEEQKLLVAKDLSRDGGNRGYRPPGIGSVSETWSQADGSPLSVPPIRRPPDLVEQFELLGDDLDPDPSHQPGFLPAMQAYYSAGVELSMLLMELTACALGLPHDYFAPSYEAGSELNRLHAAYSPAELVSSGTCALRRGEHTDFEALTILFHEGSGLQIRLRDSGQWLDVPPVPGGLTLNVGDLLQLWTNDVLRTCVHRVVDNRSNSELDDATGNGRLSLVLFTGPSPTTMIEPVNSCVSAKQQQLYSPIMASEHVNRKLRASGNVGAAMPRSAVVGSRTPTSRFPSRAGRVCRRFRYQLQCLKMAQTAKSRSDRRLQCQICHDARALDDDRVAEETNEMLYMYYKAVRIVEATATRFRVESSEVLIFDNWRVMHGREPCEFVQSAFTLCVTRIESICMFCPQARTSTDSSGEFGAGLTVVLIMCHGRHNWIDHRPCGCLVCRLIFRPIRNE
eukprot:SAG31_NODE_6739_length_1903_cov_2.716741_1_plen_524_part_00